MTSSTESGSQPEPAVGAEGSVRPSSPESAPRATTATSGGPSAPTSPAGSSSNKGPDPRVAAKAVLEDCKDRIEVLRGEVASALEGQVNRAFLHLDSTLSDKWTASDIIKDSVAMWINGYGTMKSVYDALHRFYAPKKDA